MASFGPALVVLVIGIATFEVIGRFQESRGWVEHTRQVLAAAQDARTALVDIETGQRGFLIAGEAAFDPFVQLDRFKAGVGEGAGLGLAISRELARGMGGDLWAESTVGVGSTFILALRRADGGATEGNTRGSLHVESGSPDIAMPNVQSD